MRYLVVTLGAIALIALLEGCRQVFRSFEERRREELRRRLDLLGLEDPQAETSLLRRRRLANSPAIDEVLRATPFALRLEKLLEQTDAQATVAQIIMWSGLAACTGLVAALILRTATVIAVLFAGAGLCAPLLTLLVMRSRRSARISEQLPEALDMIARSLRAGHATSAALQLVAREMPEPIALEFGRTYETQRLGVPLEQALAEMSERVPRNSDVNMLVVSTSIQKETGGNLAEILGNLAETIRARYRFYGKLKSLTAEGRASAAVIAALPFVVVLVLQGRQSKIPRSSRPRPRRDCLPRIWVCVVDCGRRLAQSDDAGGFLRNLA